MDIKTEIAIRVSAFSLFSSQIPPHISVGICLTLFLSENHTVWLSKMQIHCQTNIDTK